MHARAYIDSLFEADIENFSRGFWRWFNGSKVVDSENKPLRCYHGTGADIAEFTYEFTNMGNDQIGSGFYFTTKIDTANGYSADRLHTDVPKPGGEQPNVIPVYLSIKNPIDADSKKNLKPAQIREIILAAPDLEEVLGNWGDVEFEGRAVVLKKAIAAYGGGGALHTLNTVANDFYPDQVEAFNNTVNKVTGYDGVFRDFGNDEVHWCAWFPWQIKSAIGNSGAYSTGSRKITEMMSPGGMITTADLPDDMQVLLQDWFGFKKVPKKLPARILPLTAFPKYEMAATEGGDEAGSYDDRGGKKHAERMVGTRNLPPVIISDGNFLDGAHRVYAARLRRDLYIQVIDLSGMIDAPVFPIGRMTESKGSPEFKRWFGNSYANTDWAIGGPGRTPARLFHQTAADLNVLKPGGRDARISGPGIWLAPDPEEIHAAHNTQALGGVGQYKTGTNIIPLYARIEQPLFVVDGEVVYPEVTAAAKKYAKGSREFPFLLTHDSVMRMKADGFDGIFYFRRGNDGPRPDEVVVFDSNQVKSATANKGTYDAEHPDITEAIYGKPSDLYTPGKGKEWIASAAISFRGHIFLGVDHSTCEDLLAKKTGVDIMDKDVCHDEQLGFYTNLGRFVDRPEAFEIARGSKQVRSLDGADAGLGELDAYNVKGVREAIDAIFESPVERVKGNQDFERWFSGSKAVDGQGNPLVLYRGEHGEYTGDIHHREASISFGGPETASEYALTPNNRGDQPVAPRVMPCFLQIRNPVVNDPDDPFIDLGLLADILGRDAAWEIAVEYEGQITDTDNWGDIKKEHGYSTVQEMSEKDPEGINKLYCMAWPVLRDHKIVAQLRAKGYDGAIHAGSGMNNDEPEYKVFDQSQVKSAIGNSGKYSASKTGITEAGGDNSDFERWFDGSKIVDEWGDPQIVYHGTSRALKSFSPSDKGLFGPGIYFTSDPTDARELGGSSKKTKVHQVYLSIKNPIDISADYGRSSPLPDDVVAVLDPEIKALLSKDYDATEVLEMLDFEDRKKIEDLGYDGVIDLRSGGPSWYCAFHSSQVRPVGGTVIEAIDTIFEMVHGKPSGLYGTMKGEHIVAAAVKSEATGDIFIGDDHEDCFKAVNDSGEANLGGYLDGFYTSKGRFLNRRDAMQLAVEVGQGTAADEDSEFEHIDGHSHFFYQD